MKTRAKLQRVPLHVLNELKGPPMRAPLQGTFDLVRNDGNAGLWFHSIGSIGSFMLSVPLGLLWARCEVPYRDRPGYGTVILGLRDRFSIEFTFGKRPTA